MKRFGTVYPYIEEYSCFFSVSQAPLAFGEAKSEKAFERLSRSNAFSLFASPNASGACLAISLPEFVKIDI
jgi:hypothetical protein